MYRLIAYFLAKTLVAVPFESAVAVVFSVIVYNMIGFQAVAVKFFTFLVTLVLVNLTSDMVGFVCGVITKARRPSWHSWRAVSGAPVSGNTQL